MKFIMERVGLLEPDYVIKDLDDHIHYRFSLGIIMGFHDVRFMNREGTVLGHAEYSGKEIYVDEELVAVLPTTMEYDPKKILVDGPEWTIESTSFEAAMYDSDGKEIAYCFRENILNPLRVTIPDDESPGLILLVVICGVLLGDTLPDYEEETAVKIDFSGIRILFSDK